MFTELKSQIKYLQFIKMSRIVIVVIFLIGFNSVGQSIDYNTKKGYIAKGYDVVAYFDAKATPGNDKYTTEYDGVKLKFSNQENLQKFKRNPIKYIPKYGGYCAYAVAVSSKKVSVNPETFEIRDGELLLFYNSGKTNTLELWKKESPVNLKVSADKNWEKIKN
jgi:YHS domain-containing protein